MLDEPVDDRRLEKYFGQASGYILRRARSRHEMLSYMKQRDWPEEVRGAVVERLERSGLLDDHEFARRWVADRQALRPRSRRELEQELRVKGVEKSVVEEVLLELPDAVELEAVQSLIAKKRRTNRYSDIQLKNWLLRKGFDWRIVQKALSSDEEPRI